MKPSRSRDYLTGRYRTLIFISILMIGVNFLTRLGLVWMEGNPANFFPTRLAGILATGLVFDLAALTWILIPFSLIALLCSNGPWGRRVHAIGATMLFAGLIAVLIFVAAAEFIFWDEFASRFNFIAVDYLVYTREVIGNIRQSYPVGRILLLIFSVSLLVFALFARRFWRFAAADAPRLTARAGLWLGLTLLPAIAFLGLDEGLHKRMDSPAASELASNGLYAFFRAFRNNELSYTKYYAMLPQTEIRKVLNEELLESSATSHPLSATDPNFRRVDAVEPILRKNLVLISIESLGSDFVESFGGQKGLTPNLDTLSRESLTFHNFYATGLRTVRGLEAISLSVPPTPGRAVPIREHNKGLQTLGSVLKEHGYEPMYLYGGYALFDNMRDFFSGNGYTVIDRTSIPDEEITHETIWGVADEDLYGLALREIDSRAAQGVTFFAHIMTTSNHRPYTYPAGRVDIPSHTGRAGAVKYTDWAIGQFLKEARKRAWFDNTVFVLLADHTSHGRGRIDLPPENYRIPMWIYSPGFVQPGRVDAVSSQIDVAPTLLSLLHIGYDSHFYGQDILHQAEHHPRAFMANYLTVGYLENGMIVELGPKQDLRVVLSENGQDVAPGNSRSAHLAEEAISYYQDASAYIAGAHH